LDNNRNIILTAPRLETLEHRGSGLFVSMASV